MQRLVHEGEHHLTSRAPRVDPDLVPVSLTVDLVGALHPVEAVVFVHEYSIANATLSIDMVVHNLGWVRSILQIGAEGAHDVIVLLVQESARLHLCSRQRLSLHVRNS